MLYKERLAQARKRRAEMRKLREKGLTYSEIAARFGNISWQRVQQILAVPK